MNDTIFVAPWWSLTLRRCLRFAVSGGQTPSATPVDRHDAIN